jgi:hypothetical protein
MPAARTAPRTRWTRKHGPVPWPVRSGGTPATRPPRRLPSHQRPRHPDRADLTVPSPGPRASRPVAVLRRGRWRRYRAPVPAGPSRGPITRCGAPRPAAGQAPPRDGSFPRGRSPPRHTVGAGLVPPGPGCGVRSFLDTLRFLTGSLIERRESPRGTCLRSEKPDNSTRDCASQATMPGLLRTIHE